MGKEDKQITDTDEIESVINRAITCTMALSMDDKPYLVPLCFGYENNTVYFHSSKRGKKIDMLKRNPNVCLLFNTDVKLQKAKQPCKWNVGYKSVVASGRASFVEEIGEKIKGLTLIMNQYTQGPFEFSKKLTDQAAIIKVQIHEMTGKKND
jgi:hypothetical protein